MKRLFALICAAAVAVCALCSCSKADTKSKRLSVVATIFPLYDWTKNITEGTDSVDLDLLLDSGADMHSFQPSARDIVKISSCDVFIYVGGESEKWVDEALKSRTNKDMVTINLMDELKDLLKEEELREGMQGDSDGEEDEHIWLSLKNAQKACEAIRDGLVSADGKNEKSYKANADSYIKRLSSLDSDYQSAVEGSKTKTLLFADRFPFRYMTEDYKLNYYAAFAGCSAESEASFKTIAFLSKKTDELGLSAVLKLESSDGRVAEAVVNNTKNKNQKILTLDSMQSVTADQIKDGLSYLGVMEKNLSVLGKAL